jgi:hypothetical protein
MCAATQRPLNQRDSTTIAYMDDDKDEVDKEVREQGK